MIGVMMKLNNYADLGKRNIMIFVLINLKGGIKGDILLVMNSKIQTLKLLRRRRLFKDDKYFIQLKTEKI